jgi:hypothetical protein
VRLCNEGSGWKAVFRALRLLRVKVLKDTGRPQKGRLKEMKCEIH